MEQSLTVVPPNISMYEKIEMKVDTINSIGYLLYMRYIL